MEIIYSIGFVAFSLISLGGMIYTHIYQMRKTQELIRYLLSGKPDVLMLAEERTKLGPAVLPRKSVPSYKDVDAAQKLKEKAAELYAKQIPQPQDLGAQTA